MEWEENYFSRMGRKSSEAYRNNIDIKAPMEDTGKSGYTYSWWTSELSSSGKKNKYIPCQWLGRSVHYGFSRAGYGSCFYRRELYQ